MLFRFRRRRTLDPLQVAMTGVRMGERYLQVFCSDAALTRGLATKTGLSGTAALAAGDDREATLARKSAEKAGVLIDIKIAAADALGWESGAFDMVVVDNTGGAFTAFSADRRAAALVDMRRVLRPGGRLELIERTTHPADAESALSAALFKPVRTLAERDGFRFIEGLKG